LGEVLRDRPLESVFLLYPKLGRNEDSAPSGSGVPASRLWLEAVEPGMDVWHVGTLLGVPRIVSTVDLGSRSSLIGPITLDVKCAGARSAGNPPATCDVAGAGNQLTVRLVRHSQRKRGATDVRPAKAGMFSGRQSHRGKSQNPVAWVASVEETNRMKPTDKAIVRMVSELPGRNASEPIDGLETPGTGSRALIRWAKAA